MNGKKSQKLKLLNANGVKDIEKYTYFLLVNTREREDTTIISPRRTKI
jgi:hypothetical protein